MSAAILVSLPPLNQSPHPMTPVHVNLETVQYGLFVIIIKNKIFRKIYSISTMIRVLINIVLELFDWSEILCTCLSQDSSQNERVGQVKQYLPYYF